jgi:GNAT superfamily N-acetyltransferase
MGLNVVIQCANKGDKKAIQRFYKQQHYSASFMGFDNTYVIKKADVIIAAVIVSQIVANHSHYFLHGLVVDKLYQGNGLGKKLVNHVKNHHHPLCCFTDNTLLAWYEQLNFIQLPATGLTPILLTRYQAYQKYQKNLSIMVFK